MSLLIGRMVLFVLMMGSFMFLAQPMVFGARSERSRRWTTLAGALLLGATFAWAFYLGSLVVLSQAVIRL